MCNQKKVTLEKKKNIARSDGYYEVSSSRNGYTLLKLGKNFLMYVACTESILFNLFQLPSAPETDRHPPPIFSISKFGIVYAFG